MQQLAGAGWLPNAALAGGLQERTDASLSTLREAIEAFRSVQPKEAQAAWLSGKALAEALAELDVALDRGRAGVEKAAPRLAEETPGERLPRRP